MYINFEAFRKIKLSEEFIFFLCAVKSKDSEYLQSEFNKALIEDFADSNTTNPLLDYVKFVKKSKKSQPDWEVIRLSKKGEQVLKELSSSSYISEETKVLGEWIINYYKKRDGGIVKNKAETLRRLQWFSDITGLTGNYLAVLIKCFVSDTYQKSSGQTLEEFKKYNPRMQLSNIVDDIFWKPKDMFARHYHLDDSPLGIYYEDYKDHCHKAFKEAKLEI